MHRHLWLIGMMGVEKTTIGRLVAEHAACGFFATDDEVVASAGASIPELWDAEGEAGFRRLEAAAIAAAAGLDGPTVIATGGGAVLPPSNVAVMKGSGVVVWLTAPPVRLAERIAVAGDAEPPLLDTADPVPGDDVAVLTALLDQRHHLYEAAADHTVDTADRTVAAVAEELEALWRPM